MRKVALIVVSVAMIIVAAGCNKKEDSIHAKNVHNNIMVLTKDLTVQASSVETFDKDYYDKEELQSFMEKEIAEYNSECGKDKVKLDSLYVKKGMASQVLNYQTIKDYAEFNNTETNIFTMNKALEEKMVGKGDTFLDFQTGKKVAVEEWSVDGAYVLQINEPYELRINGKILYYKNASKEEGNLKIDPGQKAYVIFKVNK